MSRVGWLVVFAMVMFTAGAVVQLVGESISDRVLGGVAMIGAVAVVVANVRNGNGKP